MTLERNSILISIKAERRKLAKMATLQEAIENVRRLENLSLNLDEQANIEAPPASITYTCDFDTNFEDKEAFITGIARYMEEAGLHQQLVRYCFIIVYCSFSPNKKEKKSKRKIYQKLTYS